MPKRIGPMLSYVLIEIRFAVARVACILHA